MMLKDQPTLFDSPFTATQLADIGVSMAMDHANSVCEGWEEMAYEFFVSYAKSHDEFLTEDVRHASKDIVPEPINNKAWGGITRRAKDNGVIQATGRFKSQSSPNCHGSPKMIWKSLIS